MDAWLAEWFAHVRRLRVAHGFSVLGPWIGDDGATFVWILGHDEDFAAADEAYAASAERRQLEPDPARLLAATSTRFMQAPSRAPARGR